MAHRHQLRQEHLASPLAEQQLLAKRIENEQALRALNGPQKVNALAERLRSASQLDEADTVAALEPANGAALLELATWDPEVRQSDEPTRTAPDFWSCGPAVQVPASEATCVSLK